MTHTQKRKIHLDGIEYEWCIRGNDLYTASVKYITIYKPGAGGRPVYLDPYPWSLEIRPATVKKAIIFAKENGWNPEEKGKPLFLGYVDDAFTVLPDGAIGSSEYLTKKNI